MMAMSSQVRSTERLVGVSMIELVMDDMAIGNPASLVAQLWRFWALFPGVHIAQFQFQVIRNCGVILPDAVHQSRQGKILAPIIVFSAVGSGLYSLPGRPRWCWKPRLQLLVGGMRNMTVS
jgi:hypothetical protein